MCPNRIRAHSRVPLRAVLNRHRPGSPASYVESTNHRHLPWFQGVDQVIQNRVRHGLVKNPLVAVCKEIQLEALHFHTPLVRHIPDRDRREIRLSGDGTDAGELGKDEFDLEIAQRARVVKHFQDRARVVDLGLGQLRRLPKQGRLAGRGLGRTLGLLAGHGGILRIEPPVAIQSAVNERFDRV